VDHWFPEHLLPERIAAPVSLPQLGFRLGHDIYVPADGAFNRRELF